MAIMRKIAIIGAGELGQALGKILRREDREIFYWDRNEDQLSKLNLPVLSLPEVVSEADLVLFCIPSWAIKEALAFITPYWSRHSVAVLFSKGVDVSTEKIPVEIAQKLLPKNIDFVVVSGAMVAEEIGAGHFGACLVASKSSLATEKVLELFSGSNIVAFSSTDIKGVAWSGVIKNIYALGIGIAEGLGWTVNERGLLFGQATEEILRLIKILGGRKDTWLSAPIMADFATTSFDNHSLNHQAGVEIGRSGQTNKKSEGLVSLAPFIGRLKKKTSKDFPILFNLARIIIEQEDPRTVFGQH